PLGREVFAQPLGTSYKPTQPHPIQTRTECRCRSYRDACVREPDNHAGRPCSENIKSGGSTRHSKYIRNLPAERLRRTANRPRRKIQVLKHGWLSLRKPGINAQ